MKALYLECKMGIAGDMLSAALLELCPDKEAVLNELNSMGLEGVSFKLEKAEKCGITGSHFSVIVRRKAQILLMGMIITTTMITIITIMTKITITTTTTITTIIMRTTTTITLITQCMILSILWRSLRFQRKLKRMSCLYTE